MIRSPKIITIPLILDAEKLRFACAVDAHLIACGARGLLVFLQAREHLTEALLTGSRSATLGAFAADIHEFGDAIPAGASGNRIFSVREELLSLLAGLSDALVLLAVVVLVEVIDVLLRLLDCLFPLSSKLLRSLGDLCIAVRSPFLDDLGLLFVLGVGLVAGVVADRRSCDTFTRWSASAL